MKAITAPNTRSIDYINRHVGPYVWNNYFHALTTAGARSVAACFWPLHFVASLLSDGVSGSIWNGQRCFMPS